MSAILHSMQNRLVHSMLTGQCLGGNLLKEYLTDSLESCITQVWTILPKKEIFYSITRTNCPYKHWQQRQPYIKTINDLKLAKIAWSMKTVSITNKTKLIKYIKVYHCKVLFQSFTILRRKHFVDQGGQVEGAKFVTWKTTKVCQVSSFLALTFDGRGGGGWKYHLPLFYLWKQ